LFAYYSEYFDLYNLLAEKNASFIKIAYMGRLDYRKGWILVASRPLIYILSEELLDIAVKENYDLTATSDEISPTTP
jgi:hypothetical protein